MGKDNSLKSAAEKEFQEIKSKVEDLLNRLDYSGVASYLDGEIARIGNPMIKEMLEKMRAEMSALIITKQMAENHNSQASLSLPTAPKKSSVAEDSIAQFLPKIGEIIEAQQTAVAQLLPILKKQEVQVFAENGDEVAIADRAIISGQKRKSNVVNAENHNDANIITSSIGMVYDNFRDLGFAAHAPEEKKFEPVVEPKKVEQHETKNEPKFFGVLMPKKYDDHDLLTITQEHIEDAMRMLLDLKKKPFYRGDYCVLHDVVGHGHSKEELFSFRDSKLREFLQNIEDKLTSATTNVVKGAHVAEKFFTHVLDGEVDGQTR